MDLTSLRNLHFLRPAWLLAAPMLVAFALWLRWRQARTGGWPRFMDPDLVAALRLEHGGGSGGPWLLLAVLWTLAALALAGPAWQRLPSMGFRAPQDWIFVLDLSPSMAVADLPPDRVTRARYAIDDLLGAARDTRVALIAFAGEPHTVVPLTSDVEMIRALLPPLSPSLMPESGDALAPALEQSGQLMRQAGSRHARIIVLTDGCADVAQALGAAQKVADQGARVDVIGFGTAAGAPLKDAKGAFVQDAQGRSVVARLPIDQLQRIAAAGRGRYLAAADLRAYLATLRARDANPLDEQSVATGHSVSSWRNEGIWLMLPIVVFAMMIARRGWV